MEGSADKKLLLIDTDAGIDDAQAILMAIHSPNVKVIAITTCHGNTTADQVGLNVLRLLKVADRLDIPVYRGCNKPILGDLKHASHYHGMDGFGDVPDPKAPDLSITQEEHAIPAMIRLAKQYSGKLNLVALAPPTNIALALRLEPDLGSHFQNCYMMGGNYEGKGNITPSAEFNFHADPEAAHVVLQELSCPLYLVCWETCLKHSLSWAWYQRFINKDNPRARFLKSIESQTISKYYVDDKSSKYDGADQLITAVVLDSSVIKEVKQVHCDVETAGNHSRGAMVVTWSSNGRDKRPVNLVLDLHHNKFEEMFMTATN